MNLLARVCREVQKKSHITQREIAQKLEVSLGRANQYIKECIDSHYIEITNGKYFLTYKGNEFLSNFKVDNAIIIAAGFGSRFVPLTFETPKGLLEVNGERMIERQIRQLNEKGIYDITIVVGYLKEKFDYLIDKYGVKLLYNPEYSTKNNLATVYCARHLLKNTYVLSSDNWISNNMFHLYECGSWYSCVYKEGKTSEWCLKVDKKKKITNITVGGFDALVMYGPVYFTNEFSQKLIPLLEEYYARPGTEDFYWEHILLDNLDKLPIYANEQSVDNVYEFENLEELREFDKSYRNYSNNEAMYHISKVLDISESEIQNISCLKAGMTNKSFVFSAKGKDYIFRIPGQGTDRLINRKQEATVYRAIANLRISDHVVSFDEKTGYKLSCFYKGAHNLNIQNWEETAKAMSLIKKVHCAGLTVEHCFDLKERIYFYEKLCVMNRCIEFYDYFEVKHKMEELLQLIDTLNPPKVLCHIDCIPDNFIFLPDGSLKLLDWEYAGMCDPLVDIAMFAIYCYYDEDQIQRLIQLYLGREATLEEELRIDSYIALSGFLWALWTEYKQSLGDEFGEYGMKMYRYAKDYYKRAKILMEKRG